MINLIKKHWLIIISAICLLIFGLLLGLFFHHKLPLEIDQKIRYSEILNWITTLFIGLLVGYHFKNQFENNKIIKNFLLDDLKNISNQITTIKLYCYELRNIQSFSEDHRKEIVSKTNVLDKKIKNFLDLLKDCNESKHNQISENLIKHMNKYNKVLTNDGLYESQIQKSYFDDITAEASLFEGHVRKLLLDIIKNV